MLVTQRLKVIAVAKITLSCSNNYDGRKAPPDSQYLIYRMRGQCGRQLTSRFSLQILRSHIDCFWRLNVSMPHLLHTAWTYTHRVN